jgi:hypothetical protein
MVRRPFRFRGEHHRIRVVSDPGAGPGPFCVAGDDGRIHRGYVPRPGYVKPDNYVVETGVLVHHSWVFPSGRPQFIDGIQQWGPKPGGGSYLLPSEDGKAPMREVIAPIRGEEWELLRLEFRLEEEP